MSEPDDAGKCQIELIKHLSSEIAAQSAYLMTLRSRLAFTILVGPFAVLGSFLVATKGAPVNFQFWKQQLATGVLAAAAYLQLGYYGSVLDDHGTAQCNIWRRAILKLARNKVLEESDLVFEHRPTAGYMWGFALVLAAFAFIACFFILMLPSGAGAAQDIDL